MGKRYYCDFCERSFADNAQNRKKHLNGVQHQKLKKLHYDAFRDAAAILADEMAKKPCKRFSQTGECEFGDSCRFSHLGPADIQRLRQQVYQKNTAAEGKLNLPTTHPEVEVEAWLTKRKEKLANTPATSSSPPQQQKSRLIWTLPQQLQRYPKLPPSVYPPSASDFDYSNLNHWG